MIGKTIATIAAGDAAEITRVVSEGDVGQFVEAESWARKAQKAYESTPILFSGPNDWRTFYAMTLAGAALLGQGQPAEAEPLLAQGYEGMKQRAGLIGGPARVFVPASLEPVVRAYEAAGQPEKAREIYLAAAALPPEEAKKWKESVLKDFNTLRQRRLEDSLMAEIGAHFGA